MCCGCFTSSQKFGMYTRIFLTVRSMFTIVYASDFKLENGNIIMHTIFMNINQTSNHNFLKKNSWILSRNIIKRFKGCNAQHEYFFMKLKLTRSFWKWCLFLKGSRLTKDTIWNAKLFCVKTENEHELYYKLMVVGENLKQT